MSIDQCEDVAGILKEVSVPLLRRFIIHLLRRGGVSVGRIAVVMRCTDRTIRNNARSPSSKSSKSDEVTE